MAVMNAQGGGGVGGSGGQLFLLRQERCYLNFRRAHDASAPRHRRPLRSWAGLPSRFLGPADAASKAGRTDS